MTFSLAVFIIQIQILLKVAPLLRCRGATAMLCKCATTLMRVALKLRRSHQGSKQAKCGCPVQIQFDTFNFVF